MNVVTLPVVDQRDTADALRALAAEIEAGKWGDNVRTVAVSIMGDQVRIFGAGPDRDPGDLALLFAAAHHKMVAAVAQAGT